MSSLLLGVVVTKASIPTAKIVFSKVCLITTRCAWPWRLMLASVHPLPPCTAQHCRG